MSRTLLDLIWFLLPFCYLLPETFRPLTPAWLGFYFPPRLFLVPFREAPSLRRGRRLSGMPGLGCSRGGRAGSPTLSLNSNRSMCPYSSASSSLSDASSASASYLSHITGQHRLPIRDTISRKYDQILDKLSIENKKFCFSFSFSFYFHFNGGIRWQVRTEATHHSHI